MNRLRFRGFGTTSIGVGVINGGIRPNATGKIVMGTLSLTTHVRTRIPTSRDPRVARNCRNFCRLTDVGNAISQTSVRCVVHSFSHGRFRTHGHGVVRVTGGINGKLRPSYCVRLIVRSDCCGVHRGIIRRPRVLSVTRRTVHSYSVRPRLGPVHNNASNTRLSFVKLPYPGLFANNCGCRNGRRFIALRNVRGTIRIVIHVTRLATRQGWTGESTTYSTTSNLGPGLPFRRPMSTVSRHHRRHRR